MFEGKFVKVHVRVRELFRAYLKTYGNFQKPRRIKNKQFVRNVVTPFLCVYV